MVACGETHCTQPVEVAPCVEAVLVAFVVPDPASAVGESCCLLGEKWGPRSHRGVLTGQETRAAVRTCL